MREFSWLIQVAEYISNLELSKRWVKLVAIYESGRQIGGNNCCCKQDRRKRAVPVQNKINPQLATKSKSCRWVPVKGDVFLTIGAQPVNIERAFPYQAYEAYKRIINSATHDE